MRSRGRKLHSLPLLLLEWMPDHWKEEDHYDRCLEIYGAAPTVGVGEGIGGVVGVGSGGVVGVGVFPGVGPGVLPVVGVGDVVGVEVLPDDDGLAPADEVGVALFFAGALLVLV